jgi:cytidylate kinase
MARSIEEMVDHQMRRWALIGRASSQSPPRPCLAFSRLPGAGAEELGRRVAERLGYGFFDVEIVDWIARQAGLARELVAGVDEHIRAGVERFVADAFSRARFTESDYLRHVVRVVSSLGERGSAVIIGRGSPFILPPERALRVLVVAPRELRLENLSKQRSLRAAEAEQALAEEDAARLEFLRHHFARDPDDACRYDLVLNLGTLPMDAACELLVRAVGARFPLRTAQRPG